VTRTRTGAGRAVGVTEGSTLGLGLADSRTLGADASSAPLHALVVTASRPQSHAAAARRTGPVTPGGNGSVTAVFPSFEEEGT
jgi:hypothetical protein